MNPRQGSARRRRIAGVLLAILTLAWGGFAPPDSIAQSRRPPRPDDASTRGDTVVWLSPSRARQTDAEIVRVDVRIRNAVNVANAPFTIIFDPEALEFVAGESTEGTFLRRDGAPTVFLAVPGAGDDPSGRVTVGLSRLGHVAGVSGRGLLCRLAFRVKRPGPTSLSFTRARLTDPQTGRIDAHFEGVTLVPGEKRR